jgi:acetyl-CoA carboxylase biotin carboxyl carrier protein
MSKSEPDLGETFAIDHIRRLIELMTEFDLSEIDLRQSSQRIRLCRRLEQPASSGSTSPAVALPASTGGSSPRSSSAAGQEEPEENITYIRSPMVGTFYASPNPNTAAYVRVGEYVEPETTVCIIEAMKVFNEIPAEVRGRVVAVLVENEEPVDHGKPLFKIDTSR